VGQFVVLRVPEGARHAGEVQSVLAVIMSKDKCNRYQLGTQNGQLEHAYSLSELSTTSITANIADLC